MASAPLVIVLPDKRSKGDDGVPGCQPPLHRVAYLDAALQQRYPFDAHFVPYAVFGPDGTPAHAAPRVNKAGLPVMREHGQDVKHACLVLDIDGRQRPGWDSVLAGGDVAVRQWVDAQLALLESAPFAVAPRGPGGWYDTRGGLRLVYETHRPLTPEDYEHWVRTLAAEMRALGVFPDRCFDWTHLYRLPRVRRDGCNLEARVVLPAGPLIWSPASARPRRGPPSARRPARPAGPAPRRLPTRVAFLIRTDRTIARLWLGEGKRSGDLSRSGYDFSLALALLHAKVCAGEVEKTLLLRADARDRDPAYAARTVASAWALVCERRTT